MGEHVCLYRLLFLNHFHVFTVLFLIVRGVTLAVMIYRLSVKHVNGAFVHSLPIRRELGESSVLILLSITVGALANSILSLHFLIIAGALWRQLAGVLGAIEATF